MSGEMLTRSTIDLILIVLAILGLIYEKKFIKLEDRIYAILKKKYRAVRRIIKDGTK